MSEPSAIDRLAADAHAAAARPVEGWNPSHCGHSGMVIRADGSWWHEGRLITRPSLVKLFASILRREPDGAFVLVTPAEKLTIDVEDAPFQAVELATEGEGEARRIAFRLNTDDVVTAGRDRPIRVQDGRPYLAVRAGLEARIARAPFYELAEIALAEGTGGVWSDGAFFALA